MRHLREAQIIADADADLHTFIVECGELVPRRQGLRLLECDLPRNVDVEQVHLKCIKTLLL